MHIKAYILVIVFFFPALVLLAQKTAFLTGTIKDSKGNPIEAVSVNSSEKGNGVISDKEGSFVLEVEAEKNITVNFTHISFQAVQQKFLLRENERKVIQVFLKDNSYDVPEVEVKSDFNRDKPMESIDPKNLQVIPSATGNFEDLIKTQLGVSSNNELTSQYNVRGGNFDENLVYVNDIEIYRPFLIRSGNQEGLSFINSDMVENIDFSAGGFEARYGDKLSSVLAVTYKEPREFSGSFTGSLQGGKLHIEGSPGDHRFTHISGIRYRSNSYILNSLDTDGDYKPTFADVQTYMTYDITDNWQIGFLGNYARNKYLFVPETRETTFGTIQQALKLTVFFGGQEVTDFETYFGAITNTFTPKPNLELKIITSAFRSFETETFDILGQYRIDELERDIGSENFGDVAFSRGVGSYLNHARNYLDATVANIQHRGKLIQEKGFIEWGAKYQHEYIQDELSEWDLIDSAGFSKPQPPSTPGQAPAGQYPLNLFKSFKAQNTLSTNRLMGYLQQTYRWTDKDTNKFTLTYGARANYWDLNDETVISPRANIAWQPKWEKDFLFRFSTGYYYQPPFYRELRDFEGNLNKDIKAQKSIHFVLGADYNFKAWGRPFKFLAEAYYKKMENIIPFEIDNLRIRYFAENSADAYAVGTDFKINGEFVKGVDSWLNVGFLQIKEDIKGDFYYDYFNDEGEKIKPGFTLNNRPVDSVKVDPGYIPRPTDQRFNMSLFFRDYFPKRPSIQMALTIHYGSGLPFGPPSAERYEDTLRIPAYFRVDMGFSKELLNEETKLSPTSPFRHFKSIWLGLDIFNLLQRSNTLSHIWITDVTNRQYAVPNYLTSRQVNLRLQVKF